MTERSVRLSNRAHMPLVGLGTWQLRGRRAHGALLAALEIGYRHIDTATMYGNEKELGVALRESALARNEVFVTTKLPPSAAGNERRTLEASLEALDTDYIDLWLVHWPPGGAGVDTWKAFVELAEEGLARAIGVSNYSTAQIDELTEATGVTPSVNQVKWSPFLFDSALLQQCRERGVVLEGYSPFRAGSLDHALLVELGKRYAKTAAQIIVRWHIEHRVVVIPKSSHRERLAANFDVFDFSLEPDEITALDGLSSSR